MSDVYVVVEIATTCDGAANYIARDSTELIEFAWATVDATTLRTLHRESVLVRPTNTPITPYCARLHRVSWEHVKLAGGLFTDAVSRFDAYVRDELVSKARKFLFVTWDVSKLRVQLPREARDKLVVLPPYLQHPRVFDLQVEYTKWQLTHPEALSYSATLLANIVTALGVELEDDERAVVLPHTTGGGHDPAAPTTRLNLLPPTSAALSPAADSLATTRLSTMSVVYTKMLTQLIKKSMPVEAHPLVLSKPFDAALDVKVFLAERSKVLYLSNLPHDTTQSELESWFTQYGGRPVAFWTLRVLDDKVPSEGKVIKGFVVFATHEEATESLAMNGRLLNDKAVEVQASSTNVLDRANDLLTPFPPSKNRPRPGDWTCPSCGFLNFQRRTACFRCLFPATSAVAIQESIYSNPKKGSTANAAASNGGGASDMINSEHMPYHFSANNSNNSVAVNSNRTYNNNVPFRAGDWKCGSCFYHNFAKNLCCLKCGVSKPNGGPGNASNSHINYASGNNHHYMGSVNSTAAAIAASTASGIPLTMPNGYVGMPPPKKGPIGTKTSAKPFVPYGQGPKSNPPQRGNNTTPKPLIQQHMMMLQQQQQQQQIYLNQHNQYPGSTLSQHYDVYAPYADGHKELGGLSTQMQSFNLDS
jgi:hypothetical protein